MANQNSINPGAALNSGSSDNNSPHFPVVGSANSNTNSNTNSKSPASEDETKRVKKTAGAKQDESELESQLIDQTKHQIRALAQEIADLAQSQCEPAVFYQGFLTRMMSALASVGGAIWLREGKDRSLQLQYQVNLKQSILASDKEAQAQHSLLLEQLMETSEPTLVQPNSGGRKGNEAGNPTDSLLIFAPLRVSNETVGLVEMFQRANAGPTTQQGYLRFVAQMGEIASSHLTNQRLSSFSKAESMWQGLESFIRAIHQGLDSKQIAFTIANEGRRLTEVDRLSVAIGNGRNCTIQAVSGLDSVERRADQIKRLNALVSTVNRSGEPLWYEGDDSKLPPQIERKLQEYIDKSHCKMLAIIPLRQRQTDLQTDVANRRIRTDAKPQGALVIEQLKDSRISPALRQRVEVVANHSEIALTNALEHQSIFLLPVWKGLGKLALQFQGTKLLRTSLIIGALVATAMFLCFFPYSFGLAGAGTLIPETQHEVFAQENGVLKEVFVSDAGNSMVEKGDLLARMKNNDLYVEITNLTGEIEKKKAMLSSKEGLQARKLDPVDAQQIGGEIDSLKQEIKSLGLELDLRRYQEEQLEVKSPANGEVINWQTRQNLLNRPVRQGQHLMTIVDPETVWQVELRLPEKRVFHLMKAMQETKKNLPVSFGLISHPGQEYQGEVLRLDRKLDVHADDGNTVLVRIKFDNGAMPKELLKAGTRVNAKIHCGQRSVGYVLFHELIETVQTKLVLWF